VKVLKLGVAVVLVGVVLFADSNYYKRYGVKSGKIDYTITGSGNIMGIETKVVGIKRVLFDAYGAREISETNKIQRTTMDGKITTDKSHKITYMNGAIIYHVDMKKKRIVRMQNPAFMLSGMEGRTPRQFAEETMKKMGGKKIGMETVLGYDCEVWSLMGARQYLYKGIALKIESNAMGMESIEIATKAKFDIQLTDKNFKLPNFPIYNETGERLNRKKLKEMDRAESSNAAQTTAASSDKKPKSESTPNQLK
jgi:hypothetical protein